MKKVLVIGLISFSMVANNRITVDDQIDWQDVYIANNTDYDLEVVANLTDIPNINELEHVKNPVYRTTWMVPKRKDAHDDGIVKLDALNLLHNLTMKVLVPNVSILPKWMQSPHGIPIKNRKKDQILIIYIGKTNGRWLIEERYVDGVKIELQGPSGYRIKVDQP